MNSTYATNYQVLCIGVNEGPGGATLKFAEKDAVDICKVFTGALGPPGLEGYSVTEQHATRQSVIGKLQELARQPPRFLLLFFSGHGNETGILLSNGLLGFELLAAHLRQIHTQTTLIIFDTCHAAAYSGFVREDEVAGIGPDEVAWAKLLVASRPGTRLLFSTSAKALSNEAANNGRFTEAFIDALNQAPGDMGPGNILVSAQQVFKVTYGIMLSRWGRDQLPQKLGKLDDFPLVKSQVERSIGTAEIVSLSAAKGLSVNLDYVVRGRRQVATTLSIALVDGFGNTLHSGSAVTLPTSAEHVEAYELTVPADTLSRYPHLNSVLQAGGRVAAYWNIAIQDQRGRVLAEKVHTSSYKRG